MSGFGLLAVAVALGLDAFAVATAVGVSQHPIQSATVIRLAASFGLFQAFMPVLGWSGGVAVHDYIAAADHWIAFGILAFVGGRMILNALRSCPGDEPCACKGDPSKGWNLIVLSVATSIDALAVGLSIATVGGSIWGPALVIGVVAAVMTTAGTFIGCRIGGACGKGIEVAGGLVLVGIGIKVLFEHLI